MSRSLVELDLSANELEELPSTLAGCAALERLTAAQNQLKEAPAGLATLETLKLLDLSDNQISFLDPAHWRHRPSIQILLRGNPITREEHLQRASPQGSLNSAEDSLPTLLPKGSRPRAGCKSTMDLQRPCPTAPMPAWEDQVQQQHLLTQPGPSSAAAPPRRSVPGIFRLWASLRSFGLARIGLDNY